MELWFLIKQACFSFFYFSFTSLNIPHNLPASHAVTEGHKLPEWTIGLSAVEDPASTKTNGSPTFGFNVLWNRPPLTKMKEIIKKQFAAIGVHVYSSRSN